MLSEKDSISKIIPVTTNLTVLTMSIGFSFSDLVVCGQLAQNVWRGCREAPEDFRAVTLEVASLHLVLKEARENSPQFEREQKGGLGTADKRM